ncbi:MAG: HpcH/HpaI aldolase/citrate lyase family protein [Flavobacteriaceae bacterium]
MRELLADGGIALGGWMGIGHPAVAAAYAAAGHRWTGIDLQHGAISEADLTSILPILRGLGLGTIVRVPWNTPAAVMRALDLGAEGIIAPMIDTAEDAQRLVDAARYPPLGGRSWGPVFQVYPTVEAANQDVIVLPMIETSEGLANVEAIVNVEGVDGVFIGPIDLSLALNLTREHALNESQALTKHYPQIVAAAEAAGKFVASVAYTAKHAQSCVDKGMRLLCVGSDRGYLTKGISAEIAALKDIKPKR